VFRACDFAACRCCRNSAGCNDLIQHRIFDLEEVAPIDDKTRKVPRAELSGHHWLDERAPQLRARRAETKQIAARVLAQAVVCGCDEAAPEPRVVFGCEVGRVVWEVLGRGYGEEDFRRGVCEYGEEVGACVGWEEEGGNAGVVEGGGGDGEGGY